MDLNYVVAMLGSKKIKVHGNFVFDYPISEDDVGDLFRFLTLLDLSECKSISFEDVELDVKDELMVRALISYSLNGNEVEYEL